MMELEIESQQRNDLFDREEVELTLRHPNEATPSANAVRKQLAAELDEDPLTIAVDHIYSSSGLSTSTATVTIHAEPVIDELPDEEGASEEADAESGDEAKDEESPEEDNGDDEDEADAEEDKEDE